METTSRERVWAGVQIVHAARGFCKAEKFGGLQDAAAPEALFAKTEVNWLQPDGDGADCTHTSIRDVGCGQIDVGNAMPGCRKGSDAGLKVRLNGAARGVWKVVELSPLSADREEIELPAILGHAEESGMIFENLDLLIACQTPLWRILSIAS